METENRTSERVMVLLFKEPFVRHTATSLAQTLNLTRQGIWKTLNTLAKEKLINLESVGNTRTSLTLLKLNWNNPLAEKTLSLLLTKESLKQQRWRTNFAELESKVKFLIIYGSILTSPKDANDIDILAVLDKKKFKVVEEIILNIQKTQLKKIHFIDLTEEEFHSELKKPNKIYLEAIKKGIILQGIDNFIRFIQKLQK